MTPNKALSISLLILLISVECMAQDKSNSRAYKKFRSNSSGSNASSQLDKASELAPKDPAAALNLVKDALALSIAQEDVFSQGRSYNLLGEINEGIQEWKLAEENYSQAYEKLHSEYGGTTEFSKAVLGLGQSNLKLGNFESALTNFEEALGLAKLSADKQDIRLDISEAHYQMGQYDEALKDLQVPARSSLSPNSSIDVRVDNQKARIYAQQNKLLDSKASYSNSINAVRGNEKLDANEVQSFQVTKDEVADVLRSQNRSDDEIQLRNQSIGLNKAQNNMAEVAKDKVEIGKTLAAAGQTQAALREIEDAAVIADTLNNPTEQANAFLNLANLYEKTGKTGKAIGAWHKYSKAVARKDTLQQIRLLVKADLIRKQRDIEEVTKQVALGRGEETIEQAIVVRQRLIIFGLLMLILVIAVTSWFIYRNAQKSKRANQLLALKSLRSQMNPHFIFNALNSVNHFIAEQDERSANKFLSEFSQLMRLVMENSQQDFIPLYKEQEILALYLKLEHYRFRDKFDYTIETANDIHPEAIAVPPMLIQPYIENAVWHGLRYKTTPGHLTLRFHKEDNFIVAEITDDGIGRKKSQELKTDNQKKHNSTGLRNIEERIGIINKLYDATFRVAIEDMKEGGGTRVRIYIPLASAIKEAV